MQKKWELVKERQTTEEIKNEMFVGTDHEGRNAWHKGELVGKLDVVQKIWK